jgi:hypothetical protein
LGVDTALEFDCGTIVVDSSGQAERVLQRLKNGEDFSEIARAVSIDPAGRDSPAWHDCHCPLMFCQFYPEIESARIS